MAVLIIFPVFLQTVINLIMLSIGGHGALRVLRDHGVRPSSLATWHLPCYRARKDFHRRGPVSLMPQIAAASTRSWENPNVWNTATYVNTLLVADLFAAADDALFSRMTANLIHVLQPLLPDQSNHHYNRHQWLITQKSSHFKKKKLSLQNLVQRQLLVYLFFVPYCCY